MTWIFIGALLGSIVTSSHDTREACEGRKTVLAEKGVIGECRQIPRPLSITGGTHMLCMRGDGVAVHC